MNDYNSLENAHIKKIHHSDERAKQYALKLKNIRAICAETSTDSGEKVSAIREVLNSF
jgi:hypothetical protein